MSQPKQKKIEYRGITYVGIIKGGSVSVRSERTDRGQNLLMGTYNVSKNTWHNEDQNGALPEYIKKEIEKSFA